MIYKNLKHYLVTYKNYRGVYMKMSIWAHDENEMYFLFYEQYPKYEVVEFELIPQYSYGKEKKVDEKI